ncbi:MAG TPA: hypothetical protein VFD94_06925 [Jatrophihabitans sp.]|nr:hypothetical protein [Jatrophihabitans sp.]
MTEFTGDQERASQPEYGAPPVPPAVPPPVSGYPPAQGDYAAPPTAGYQQPPADYPPAAPPAAAGHRPGGFDPANLQNFDPKTVNPLDWGIIAAGVLAFIFSLFAFYTYSVSVSIAGLSSTSSSVSWSAWHGFFGWFGVLLALIGALLLAAQLIAKVTLPFPIRTVVLVLFGVATLCLLLALIVVPGNTGGSSLFGVHVNKGHGFGYWVTLLAVLVGTGLAVKRFLDTGGKLPSRA